MLGRISCLVICQALRHHGPDPASLPQVQLVLSFWKLSCPPGTWKLDGDGKLDRWDRMSQFSLTSVDPPMQLWVVFTGGHRGASKMQL